MTAFVTFSPRCCSAASRIFCRIMADTSGGGYSLPSIETRASPLVASTTFPAPAHAVVGWADELGVDRVHLVGLSFGGMIAQGPLHYWQTLVPHVPWPIWPIMFAVEFIGIFVKPFALMIRLFANMTGGHMVVLSFMGLLFLVAGMAGSGAMKTPADE